ncbi:uncharacterized protein [Rutidosis leptorrhynchoides]|uniref:uncharacterized protein n=1 Tax=Rutidosis leptorrhynchoides TaxID=125765 RepID=UPI003A9A3B6C
MEERKGGMALGCGSIALSTELLNTIMEQEETTAAAWSRLQSVFHDNRNSRALYLHKHYSTIKLDDFANVSTYCQEIKSLADQLMNVGDKVSNERMVLQLIARLNDNFDTVETYFTQLDKLPSFYEARSKLILEETRKQKQMIHNSPDTALLAAATATHSSPGWGRGYAAQGHPQAWAGYPPWNYQQTQWAQPPCPYPSINQTSSPANWTWPNTSSSNAGILGPRPQANIVNPSASPGYSPTELDNALHTMTLNPSKDTWYMDMGATSHMAANSEFDPFGFTVKDFPQGTPILRCNSTGELYSISTSLLQHLSSLSTFAFTALSPNV